MNCNVLLWLWNEQLLRECIQKLPAVAVLGIIAACLFLLSKGADWLIDGVVLLARRMSFPEIIIGATVVSLGTTTPEAFVSVTAAYMGDPGLALGNGVGSIIADTGLVFGVTCLLTRVPVKRYILNRTGWFQIGSATLLVLLALVALFTSPNGPQLGRWVGGLLTALLFVYLAMSYRWALQGQNRQKGKQPDLRTAAKPAPGLLVCWSMVVGGLLLVLSGARILVPSASEIAVRIGVPSDVIAATMVALGTSLPELMTAIVSVRKGYPEIMVGNVVGADVLNCLFVIGAAALARPLAIPATFYYLHFPVMLLILYSFRLFIFTSRKGFFHRGHGAWLLGIYLFYIIFQYTMKGALAG